MTTRKFPYASPLPSDVHHSSFLSGKPDAAPSALLPRGVKVSIKGGLYLLPRSLECLPANNRRAIFTWKIDRERGGENKGGKFFSSNHPSLFSISLELFPFDSTLAICVSWILFWPVNYHLANIFSPHSKKRKKEKDGEEAALTKGRVGTQTHGRRRGGGFSASTRSIVADVVHRPSRMAGNGQRHAEECFRKEDY